MTNLKKKAWWALTDYEPHAAQKQIHASQARFIMAICGRRFGKSLLAAKEIEIEMMSLEPKRIWIVAPTYELTDKVFREVYKTFHNPKIIINGAQIKKHVVKSSESKRFIRTSWGTEVIGKSADNPTSLYGEGLDLLVMDECAQYKDDIWYKYLRPTLSDRNGRALFISTPEGTNWLHRLYETPGADYARFQFKSVENPIVAPDAENARGELPDNIYKMMYEADFYAFEGKVYLDFSADRCVIPQSKLPKSFDTLLMGVDFGFKNPCAMIVLGYKDQSFYVLDEFYKSGTTPKDRLEALTTFRKKYGDIWNI